MSDDNRGTDGRGSDRQAASRREQVEDIRQDISERRDIDSEEITVQERRDDVTTRVSDEGEQQAREAVAEDREFIRPGDLAVDDAGVGLGVDITDEGQAAAAEREVVEEEQFVRDRSEVDAELTDDGVEFTVDEDVERRAARAELARLGRETEAGGASLPPPQAVTDAAGDLVGPRVSQIDALGAVMNMSDGFARPQTADPEEIVRAVDPDDLREQDSLRETIGVSASQVERAQEELERRERLREEDPTQLLDEIAEDGLDGASAQGFDIERRQGRRQRQALSEARDEAAETPGVEPLDVRLQDGEITVDDVEEGTQPGERTETRASRQDDFDLDAAEEQLRSEVDGDIQRTRIEQAGDGFVGAAVTDDEIQVVGIGADEQAVEEFAEDVEETQTDRVRRDTAEEFGVDEEELLFDEEEGEVDLTEQGQIDFLAAELDGISPEDIEDVERTDEGLQPVLSEEAQLERAADEFDDFGAEDLRVDEDEGEIVVQEDAIREQAREEIAEEVPALDPDDIVLEEDGDEFAIDREATAVEATDAEDPDPGRLASAIDVAGDQLRGTPVGAAATVAAISLRTEDGLPTDSLGVDATLPGQRDVDRTVEAIDPAAQAFDDAVETTLDTSARVTEPIEDRVDVDAETALQIGSAGALVAGTQAGRDAIRSGVETGIQTLNPAAFAQDAVRGADIGTRATERVMRDDAAEDIQQTFDVAEGIGEITREAGPPLAAAAVVDEPTRAIEAPVAAGTVLVGGAAGGAAIGAGARGGAAVGRGGIRAAQRTGRRIARSDRRPTVEVTRDPDADLLEVETPDVSAPEVNISGAVSDVATGARRAADPRDPFSPVGRTRDRLTNVPGRVREGASDLATDARFSAQQAQEALDPTDPFSPAGRVTDRVAGLPERARSGARSVRADARFSAEELGRRIGDLDFEDIVPDGPDASAPDVSLRALDPTDPFTPAGRAADRVTSIPDDVAQIARSARADVRFSAQRAQEALNPTDPFSPAGRAAERVTGFPERARRGARSFRADARFSAAEFGRRIGDLDFEDIVPSRPEVSGSGIDISRPEFSTPSLPTVGVSRPSVRGRLDGLEDLTVRVDLTGGQQGRSQRVIDVEDLTGPDPADGAPRVSDPSEFEDPAPAIQTDVDVDAGPGQSGQLTRLQQTQEQPRRGTAEVDTLQRADELDVEVPGTGAAAAPVAGLGEAASVAVEEAEFADATTAAFEDSVTAEAQLTPELSAVGDGLGLDAETGVGTGQDVGERVGVDTLTTPVLRQPTQRITAQTQNLRQPTRQRGSLRLRSLVAPTTRPPTRPPTPPIGVPDLPDADDEEFFQDGLAADDDRLVRELPDPFGDDLVGGGGGIGDIEDIDPLQ